MKMKKVFTALWLVLGISLGGALALLVLQTVTQINQLAGEDISLTWYSVGIMVGVALGGLMGQFTAERVYDALEEAMRWLQSRPLMDVVSGGGGLIVGLVIAFLLSQLTTMLQSGWLALVISVMLYLILGYMGVLLGLKHRDGWKAFLPARLRRRFSSETEDNTDEEEDIPPKILDTSVLVDGRIERILATGFVEGPLVAAAFVTTELQHLADSADELKRKRGRRGLEVLQQLEDIYGERITISELDNDRIAETDGKLLWLTRQLKGKLITLDYNLGKVAAVQSIPVLNINELAGALKPAARAGDQLAVKLMKEGKDPTQGVGYLPDGTMVVVEQGRDHIGEEVTVTVTSALQTAAGRMIFGKIEAM